MRHSHLNKRKAFDFIALELEAGRQPTDQQLEDLCGFFNREHVKTLLADLADEGAISISWDGPERTITLGPKERAKLASVRPIPSVVRPAVLRRRAREARALDPDLAASRIMAIMRGDSSLAPDPRQRSVELVPEPNSSVGTELAGNDTILPSVEDRETIAPLPGKSAEEQPSAPQAVEARPRLAGVPSSSMRGPKPRIDARTKQISTLVTPALYERIRHAAFADGTTVSSMGAQLLEEACAARDCRTDRKHRLSAAVLRAWRSDGRSLDEFVTWLIELGLEEHGRILAHAEAAE